MTTPMTISSDVRYQCPTCVDKTATCTLRLQSSYHLQVSTSPSCPPKEVRSTPRVPQAGILLRTSEKQRDRPPFSGEGGKGGRKDRPPGVKGAVDERPPRGRRRHVRDTAEKRPDGRRYCPVLRSVYVTDQILPGTSGGTTVATAVNHHHH